MQQPLPPLLLLFTVTVGMRGSRSTAPAARGTTGHRTRTHYRGAVTARVMTARVMTAMVVVMVVGCHSGEQRCLCVPQTHSCASQSSDAAQQPKHHHPTSAGLSTSENPNTRPSRSSSSTVKQQQQQQWLQTRVMGVMGSTRVFVARRRRHRQASEPAFHCCEFCGV